MHELKGKGPNATEEEDDDDNNNNNNHSLFADEILDHLEDGQTDRAIEVLRQRGPFEDDINAKDFYGRSLLNNAVRKQDEAFVGEMLRLDLMGVYKRRLRLDDCITVAVREMNYDLVSMLLLFADKRRRRPSTNNNNNNDDPDENDDDVKPTKELPESDGKLAYHCPPTKRNILRRKDNFSVENNNNNNKNCRHCGRGRRLSKVNLLARDLPAAHRLRYTPSIRDHKYHNHNHHDKNNVDVNDNDNAGAVEYQHGMRRVTSTSSSLDFPDILVENPLLQAAIMDTANVESKEAHKTIHDIIRLLLDWGFDVPWPDDTHHSGPDQSRIQM